LSHTVISDVQVSGDFSPGNPAAPASRGVQMLLNGVPVGDGNVPEQTHLSFPADAGLITAGWQTIGLRAVNQNSAHYTVADRFTLQMNVSYTGSVCAPATAGIQLMSGEARSCQVEETPEPSLTPTPGGSTSTPEPSACSATVVAQDGVNLRERPEIDPNNVITRLNYETPITIMGRTEGSLIDRWYLVVAEGAPRDGWVKGEFVNPQCDNVPIHVGPDLFTATPTHTPTATFTPTYGPSPTPTPTPTSIPRIVETQAQEFHNRARQFGLPAPFALWPVVEEDLFQAGYGPNWYVYFGEQGACLTPTVPPPTTAPEPTAGPTPTRVPDACQYRNTNGIHTGMDWYTQSDELIGEIIPSDVIALCDGIIVPGRTSRGGSAGDNAGDGLSLRCFADDPNETDNDGLRNISNIVVVYNHLTLAAGIDVAQSGGPYQIVRAGDVIATTAGYTMRSGNVVRPHLHLELFLAYGYQASSYGIQLNPRLMFESPMSRPEREQQPYPSIYPEGVWTLQGIRKGISETITYLSDSDNPIFIEDAAGYIEANLLPANSPYVYPNCTNLPASSNDYGQNRSITHCTLDRNDINVTPTPTP
jgi:murein DD-endopeptidase MepM/ murein hydrolase activator NlpD